MSVENQSVRMGPSRLRRFGYSFGWTIFGLLFFYIALVVMSYYSKGVTLERMDYNGWPRMATRATGGITVPFYVLTLIVNPASTWTLFFTVMTVCSHLVHLMILASDVRVFEDKKFAPALKAEGNHPLLKHIPTPLLYIFGIFGFLCLFVLGAERAFGPGLRLRQRHMNIVSKGANLVVWTEFVAFFVDRLAAALVLEKSNEELMYPIYFLVQLAVGAAVAIARDRAAVRPMMEANAQQKKEQ